MKRLQVLFAVFLIVALAGGVAFAQSGYDLFQKALAKERAEGKLEEAIQIYKQIVREHASDRTLAAKALVQMGLCYEKLGNVEAKKAYERVVREFADQPEAAIARVRLAALQPAASSSANAVAMRQVWEKGDMMGMVSPDGRYLSFTDWSTGNVALRDLVSGTNRPLTSKASWSDSVEYAEFSIISHDGKQVAYAWLNSKSFAYDLRVIGVDGSNPRVFHAGSAGEYVLPIGWLPDGKSIAAGFQGKGLKIGLVSEGDGAVRVLKSLDGFFLKPALSPDGRYIAYEVSVKKDGGHQRDIFLLATDGSGEVPLVVHPADDSVFSWAPDGQSLLFHSDRSGTEDLWNIAVAGGKPRGEPKRIKQEFTRKTIGLGFTANQAIFYGLTTGSLDVYVAKLAPGGTKLIAPPEPVTQRFVGGNSAPEWSPDGRSLAYITKRGVGPGTMASGLWVTIKTLETGKERELHPALSQANTLRWSPDGKSLLVWGRAEGPMNTPWGAYRIDVNTGVAEEIVLRANDATGFVRFPRWSSDGEAIYFVGGPVTGRCIFRRDLRTGQRTEIFRAPKETPWVGSVELSPDGKWLAFGMDPVAHQPSHVMMALPIAGGTPRELLRLVAPEESAMLHGWTADSHSILITKQDIGAKKPVEVLRLPLEGGSPQPLDLQLPVAAGLGNIRMHPDGQRIAFSSGEYKFEVWVMENLFPKHQAAK